MPKKPKDDLGPVERLKAALQTGSALPPAPRRTHTKRHAVEELRELLVSQIATRGCTMQGLADYLSQHGLKIYPITLRLYLGDVRPYRQAYRRRQDPAARTGDGDGQGPTAAIPVSCPERPSAPVGSSPAALRKPPAVGSPEAAAKLEAALADALQTSHTVAAAPSEPVVLAGTFMPRPERPIDWLPKKTGSA